MVLTLGMGGGVAVPPPVSTPGPGARRQQDGVQAALMRPSCPRCSASPCPPPGWGAQAVAPAVERGVRMGPQPLPDLR